MSILHTKTRKKRHFRDCDAVLDEVFGEGFAKNHKKDVFVQIEPYSIGSGCIAQVMAVPGDLPYMVFLVLASHFKNVLLCGANHFLNFCLFSYLLLGAAEML